ncbi:uncharacterized protein LOC111871497 [Cryptotermes secundus]|uniref:uncharacterized protein LOC111871497 n=1 Tax=Cryptotermes secundus TaxID=105785 RepID=UPI000CD7AC1C|nr:uncharacterized protein LOC111871497 [Cryptotermes secundus]
MEGIKTFMLVLMLAILAGLSHHARAATQSPWCAARCVAPKCHVTSRDFCKTHPGTVYEPKGGFCGCCPGCVRYVDVGGSCSDPRLNGFYVKCRNSTCNNDTKKCEASG